MSTHPSKEKLAELAWDALEGAEADPVEEHVAGCAECALQVERVRAEARKLTAALEVNVPAGLAGRILDAVPAAETRRGSSVAWVGLAAAALFAVTTAWAWRGMDSANRRIDRLEKELASRPTAAPVVAENLEEEMRKAVAEIGRNKADVDTGIVLAGVDPTTRDEARPVLLARAEATTELFVQAMNGTVDYDTLRSTDMLAGIDADLKEKIKNGDLAAVLAGIDRASRGDATAAATALTNELQAIAGLDQAQADSLKALLMDKVAWRRDFHFLPEVMQRELVARAVGFGGTLRPEAGGLFNAAQKSKVVTYLASAESERARYWEGLRRKSKIH